MDKYEWQANRANCIFSFASGCCARCFRVASHQAGSTWSVMSAGYRYAVTVRLPIVSFFLPHIVGVEKE